MSRAKAKEKEVVQEVEEEVEEQCGPLSVTKLEVLFLFLFSLFTIQAAGISAAEIKKLKECGFQTVESVAFATRKTLLALKFSEIKADKIISEGSISSDSSYV